MFRVGDRVRIRDWDDMAAEFGVDDGEGIICAGGRLYFLTDMRHLCGRTAKISRINGNYMNLTAWSNSEGTEGWDFSKDMVVPALINIWTPEKEVDDIQIKVDAGHPAIAFCYSVLDRPQIIEITTMLLDAKYDWDTVKDGVQVWRKRS